MEQRHHTVTMENGGGIDVATEDIPIHDYEELISVGMDENKHHPHMKTYLRFLIAESE